MSSSKFVYEPGNAPEKTTSHLDPEQVAIATRVKEEGPGKVFVSRSKSAAAVFASRVRRGQAKSWAEVGTFACEVREVEDGFAVWAEYIGK